MGGMGSDNVYQNFSANSLGTNMISFVVAVIIKREFILNSFRSKIYISF